METYLDHAGAIVADKWLDFVGVRHFCLVIAGDEIGKEGGVNM